MWCNTLHRFRIDAAATEWESRDKHGILFTIARWHQGKLIHSVHDIVHKYFIFVFVSIFSICRSGRKSSNHVHVHSIHFIIYCYFSFPKSVRHFIFATWLASLSVNLWISSDSVQLSTIFHLFAESKGYRLSFGELIRNALRISDTSRAIVAGFEVVCEANKVTFSGSENIESKLFICRAICHKCQEWVDCCVQNRIRIPRAERRMLINMVQSMGYAHEWLDIRILSKRLRRAYTYWPVALKHERHAFERWRMEKHQFQMTFLYQCERRLIQRTTEKAGYERRERRCKHEKERNICNDLDIATTNTITQQRLVFAGRVWTQSNLC